MPFLLLLFPVKPGVPVFTSYDQPPEGLEVLWRRAEEVGAPFNEVPRYATCKNPSVSHKCYILLNIP